MPRDGDDFRIDVDLGHAEREAGRVRTMLEALRRRHDLARFEYTRLVQIVPAGPTHSHPILTLGTRFAESEDQLLATYLHEQMHWYLWRLGGPDHDPVEPFFDELVRRYPRAPTRLPEGARNYEQTYVHLVVCWLEIAATAELIGDERALTLCETHWGYRWIYRTVRRDREALGDLLRAHAIVPMKTPAELAAEETARKRATQPSRAPGEATRKATPALRLTRPAKRVAARRARA
jgi:hypothetical protein